MATAFIMIGSLAGLLAGVVSYTAFDVPALAALAIWVLAGPLSAAIVLLASQPRQAVQSHSATPARAS